MSRDIPDMKVYNVRVYVFKVPGSAKLFFQEGRRMTAEKHEAAC